MDSANKRQVLVDTGPLVAFLRRDEEHHAWVSDRFAELPAPLLTCEPVLTEALFLLSKQAGGQRVFFDLLASGLLQVSFSVQAEHRALSQLMMKYKDLPMSLADACLVRMAELYSDSPVFTLDKHFRVYRRNSRRTIPLIVP